MKKLILEENYRLCSELWVSPCGATKGFLEESILRSEGGVKTQTQTANLCSFLPSFPRFKTKSCFVIFENKTTNIYLPIRRKCTVVSLFIIITIVTINCVINAIQQLCKQAVSDAVSYLQYEDHNNDDVFTLFVVNDLVSHRLNHHRPVYTATGFTTVVELVSPGLRLHISPPETSYHGEKVAFFRNRGENVFPLLTPHDSSFIPAEIGEHFSH